MKIVHTADWHLGKIINEVSMIENQKYFIENFKLQLQEMQADILIIAGDIYDRAIAPVEAIKLFDDFIDFCIIKLKIKVLIINGNHDGQMRLGFGSDILQKQGLYIVGSNQKLYEKISVDDTDFYLIGYKDPSQIKNYYEQNDVTDHNSALSFTIENIKKELDSKRTNIAIYHGYVTTNYKDGSTYKEGNLNTTDSERPLAIGGTDIVAAKNFDVFDYVALGHIHRLQQITKNRIYYSGSPLKYSFSEANDNKQIIIYDTKTKQIIKHNTRFKYDLRLVSGAIEEILKLEPSEDYIQATIIDGMDVLNPMQQIREIFPNALSIITPQYELELIKTINKSERYKSETELFEMYYQEITNLELTEKQKNLIIKITDQVLKEQNETN